MSDKQYFIGLCSDVGTYKFVPLEFIKFNLDYVLMYMFYVGYVLCLHAYFSFTTHMYGIQ